MNIKQSCLRKIQVYYHFRLNNLVYFQMKKLQDQTLSETYYNTKMAYQFPVNRSKELMIGYFGEGICGATTQSF